MPGYVCLKEAGCERYPINDKVEVRTIMLYLLHTKYSVTHSPPIHFIPDSSSISLAIHFMALSVLV